MLAGASVATARRTGQRIGHGLVGLAALWSLIAALIFTGPALTWLVLADAIALGVLALADLAAHEVSTENVVHRLEVTGELAAVIWQRGGSPPEQFFAGQWRGRLEAAVPATGIFRANRRPPPLRCDRHTGSAGQNGPRTP